MNPATELKKKIERIAENQRKAYEELIEVHQEVTKIEERIENDQTKNNEYPNKD